jgi:LPS export ABC transporter protein LptC
MRLFAKEFARNEHARRPYIDMNKALKIEFYNDSGIVEHLLTADSSRYYDAQGDIIVWDSVQVVTRKGERLNTPELIWNNGAQKFFTEKEVRITTPTEILYGKGLEANRDFSWYKIIEPRGVVQVNKGELPQ